MTESKRSSKPVFAPLKVALDLDEIEAIERKAIHQHITQRLRDCYKSMPLEDLIQCKLALERKELGAEALPSVKFQQLLEADLYARTMAPQKEKKTSTQHFVTFNPKDDTCVVCFQEELIDFLARQQALNKLVRHEWVLEFTKKGGVHAHSIMQFEQPLAVSQVRDRYFKKLTAYCQTKQHIVVKAINNIKGIRDYMNNSRKGEKEEKKEAADMTAQLREEYQIKDLYIMAKAADGNDHYLSPEFHSGCMQDPEAQDS